MNNQKSKRVKRPIDEKLMDIFLYLFFTVFTLICIYPFYYLIINTLSANDLSASGKILFYPRKMHIENYIQVFQIPGLKTAAIMSLGRTVLGTLGTVFGSAFLGFMFTQDKMWGRKFFYRCIVITMYFNAGIIPYYITMSKLGLTNNFWVYVLPGIVAPFNIILIKTYIESTPKSLQEAAEIDGAGVLTRFCKIVIPISKPILATIAIFTAVGQWNSFQDTLLLMTEQKYYTLQYILYKYINQASSLASLIKNNTGSMDISAISAATQQTATSVRMTVSVIVVLPILLIYPLFQRFFVKGIMIGSVKG